MIFVPIIAFLAIWVAAIVFFGYPAIIIPALFLVFALFLAIVVISRG
ncbi:MAG: hypothetical protein AAGG56_12560 [Pseudomonadota bacterium]